MLSILSSYEVGGHEEPSYEKLTQSLIAKYGGVSEGKKHLSIDQVKDGIEICSAGYMDKYKSISEFDQLLALDVEDQRGWLEAVFHEEAKKSGNETLAYLKVKAWENQWE